MALLDETRRDSLRVLLFELSESQDIFRDKKKQGDIARRLEEIYFSSGPEESNRHLYSDIFSWLTRIDIDQGRDIDVLAQNLTILQKEYRPTERADGIKDITSSLYKLYDHVNLDVARIHYVKKANEQLKASFEIDELKKRIEKQEDMTQEIEETAAEAEKTVRNAQKESTAILGIFAAIVLAFTGGMIFSTSVFENLDNSSIYRVALMAVVIAFALINIIYMLLRFVASLEGIEGIGFDIKTVDLVLLGITALILLSWVIDLPYLVQKLHTNLYG